MNPHRLNILWAKTSQESKAWHPLLLHLLDVAVVADLVLAREPRTTRMRFASMLGLSWEDARPWLLLLIACHDIGKACPGFQLKWDGVRERLEGEGYKLRPVTDTHINHAYVSQVVLSSILLNLGWEIDLAELVADAVGCHHGTRASATSLQDLEGNSKSMGSDDWQQARFELFMVLKITLGAVINPTTKNLSGSDFMLLSGLTSFTDWIGSNDDWFPFGTLEDCVDLDGWLNKRRSNAENALDTIGWYVRDPLLDSERSFNDLFGFAPRPLQDAIAKAVSQAQEPCIFLVEAPMGEGKTEAAFYTHLELQRRLGHRGLYVALPTKATGNAMFERTLQFLQGFIAGRNLDLQLLHGATLLNDSFQNLRLNGIWDDSGNGSVQAREWFSHKKRALLSDYGVGTVDQALMPILPVRHNFVRLWGLANRVIVFDEIHAYDAYTGTLLLQLLRWLLALDSSVILLSATLPPVIRDRLAALVCAQAPVVEEAYPRLSVFRPQKVEQIHFDSDPARRRLLKVKGVSSDPKIIVQLALALVSSGGMAVILVNTVQRAQDLYRLFSGYDSIIENEVKVGCRLVDLTEVYLFHARFPANERQVREDLALRLFGKNGTREGSKILIATQVAEQSLDLDFDFLITDLAPIDLVLQRAGRLWRHIRNERPVDNPILYIAGLQDAEPPSLGKPLWWNAVYREDILLRTWALLKSRQEILLPDDIDGYVNSVYEGTVELNTELQIRVDAATISEDGEEYAHRNLANMAHIGFPDDSSWNDPARFSKSDEDDPGVHPSLVAKTRWSEGSAVVVPIWSSDQYEPHAVPEFQIAKKWFLRSLSLSRKGVVARLQEIGVPEGWKNSPLLRNCIPMELDEKGRWIVDASVQLDDELGLTYANKETP